MVAPGHSGSLLPADSEQAEEQRKKKEDDLNRRLEEESSAFFSSGRLWDDGVILPQDTRRVRASLHQNTTVINIISTISSFNVVPLLMCLQVLRDCLDIIRQQQYQLSTEKVQQPLLRL